MTAAIIANCVELNLLQTKIITPYYIFNHLYSANIRDVNNNMFLRVQIFIHSSNESTSGRERRTFAQPLARILYTTFIAPFAGRQNEDS